jgi:hypothetical protein
MALVLDDPPLVVACAGAVLMARGRRERAPGTGLLAILPGLRI